MGRPSNLTGWWNDVCEELANGRIDVLASLFEINPKTLNRWVREDIKKLHDEHRKHCREVLGRKFLPPTAKHPNKGRRDCPALFRNPKKSV